MSDQGPGDRVVAAGTPSGPPPGPPPGLCGNCRHAQVIETRKGSRFFRCRLSEGDPAFPRYPRLPVLVCTGWSRRPVPGPGTDPAGTEGAVGEAGVEPDADPEPGR